MSAHRPMSNLAVHIPFDRALLHSCEPATCNMFNSGLTRVLLAQRLLLYQCGKRNRRGEGSQYEARSDREISRKNRADKKTKNEQRDGTEKKREADRRTRKSNPWKQANREPRVSGVSFSSSPLCRVLHRPHSRREGRILPLARYAKPTWRIACEARAPP